MLALAQLLGLERSLRGRRVLSVFVDTTVTDPASRSGWRSQLDRAFARLHSEAGGRTPGDRTALELCLAHVRTALEGARGAPGRPGWVAYATTDDVVLAEAVSTPVKTRVYWQHGMVIAPLLAQGAVVGASAARLDLVTGETRNAPRFLPTAKGAEPVPVAP